MGEPFVCECCTVYRPNRRALWVALTVTVVGVGVGIGGTIWADPHPFAAIGMACAVLGLVATNAIGRYFMLPASQAGEVRADGEGIDLDGKQVLSRPLAERGFLRRLPGQAPRVRFVGPRGKILCEVELPKEGEAKRLLRAAELDTQGKVARFHLSHPWVGKPSVFIALSWTPLLLGGVVAFGVSALVELLGGSDDVKAVVTTLALAALAVGGLLLYRQSRTRLVIGPDGVHLGRFGQERYLAWNQIEAARPWADRVTRQGTSAASEGFDLVLRSGETIGLRTMAQRLRQGEPNGDFILDEVRAALADHGQNEESRLGALDRGGRTTADWIQNLQGLGEGAQAGHRSAAAPVDELWRVLEDPKAQAGQRAASAVALSASGDAAARQRVVRLCRATANPSLQAALEAAAQDDLAELERAMSRVDGSS